MQKSLFQENQDMFSANQITVDEAYLTKIQIEANRLRAQAFANVVGSLTSGIAKLFAGIVTWVKVKSERSRVLNQLYSMDDRTLADIGLTRGDIHAIVNGTLKREPLQPVPANLAFMKKSTVKSAASKTEDDTRIAA